MVKTKKSSKSKKGVKKNRSKKAIKGGTLNTGFMDALRNANVDYIRENVRNMEDLSFEDASGYTPLDIAINGYNEVKPPEDVEEFERFVNYEKIIRILLENGANGENITLPFTFDLSKGNFEGINLQNANLLGVNFESANLTNANLQNTKLNYADLTNTNFTGANMNGTMIDGSNTTGANFSNTILSYEDDDDDDENARIDGTTTDFSQIPPSEDNVWRTSTDIPITSHSNTSIMGSYSPESTLEYDLNNISNIEGLESNNYVEINDDPLHQSNDDWLIGLMDTRRDEDIENERRQESERLERQEKQRKEMKTELLRRGNVTLTKTNVNPFPRIGMTGFHNIQQEDVQYCDHIKEDSSNLLFIWDKQVAMVDRSQLERLINNETLDPTKIVYQCNQLDVAFIPRNENIISGPALNMDIIGMLGIMIPLEYLDEVVNKKHQIFIIESTDGRNKIPIASLNTRLSTGAESGAAVIGANHCQAEVSIKSGKISYIENNVLETECTKIGGKKRKTRRKKGKKLKGSRRKKNSKKQNQK